MEIWRLIDLKIAEPYTAQMFYEAVAQAVDDGNSPNTIILIQPSEPYVCIGFHQELEKEIDTEFCRIHELPIIRRSQGGITYLNNDQLFYQVIARKSSTIIPSSVEKLFESLLAVTVHVYRRL